MRKMTETQISQTKSRSPNNDAEILKRLLNCFLNVHKHSKQSCVEVVDARNSSMFDFNFQLILGIIFPYTKEH